MGNLVSAGLPNISGSFTTVSHPTYPITGAFTNSYYGVGQSYWAGSDNSPKYIFTFNASGSSAIYGSSETVTPASLVVNFYISY